jgi:GABA(A) receptor-associated protein
MDELSFEERKQKALSLRSKYISHIPVLIKREGTNVPEIDSEKFLVPSDFTVSQLVCVIRKRVNVSPEKAVFLSLGKAVFPSVSQNLLELDEKYRDEDQFLRIKYYGEETFG